MSHMEFSRVKLENRQDNGFIMASKFKSTEENVNTSLKLLQQTQTPEKVQLIGSKCLVIYNFHNCNVVTNLGQAKLKLHFPALM